MRSLLTAGLAVLLAAGPAGGAPTNSEKCESAKLKVAGKYALCLLKAQSKFAKTSDAAKLAEAQEKCAGIFAASFAKAENNGRPNARRRATFSTYSSRSRGMRTS
jgi:hypothetical protein